jgi:hypothetical protein
METTVYNGLRPDILTGQPFISGSPFLNNCGDMIEMRIREFGNDK